MMSLDNSFLFPYQPSLDWDPHTFQLGDLHQQQHFMPLGRWKLPILLFFGLFEHDSPTSLGDGISSYGVSGIIAGLDRLLARRSGGVGRPVQAETRDFVPSG